MDIRELKERKKALKLTTAELAYLAELPVGTVSKIMTGETRKPTYITIEKLNAALTRLEMLHRLEAYINALKEHLATHPDESLDQRAFEREYRRLNNLSDAPIPFAEAKAIITGDKSNLALKKDNRMDADILHEIGEDKRIELIDGHIVYNEAPNLAHQIMVQSLGKIIDRFIEDNNGSCQMFNVGVNVRLDEDDLTLVIPDIAVICNKEQLDENGINGAPDWIIEVVSRSTRHADYNDKLHKYMHAGVREYWIIDPEKEKVATYIEGEPMMVYIYSFDDDIPVYIYDGKLNICINNL